MKCTCRTRKFCVGDPTQPIFYWFPLGFCVRGNANFMFRLGGKANFSVFRYQHVGIANANSRVWGARVGHNASSFALQWNIGLRDIK